MIRGTIGVKAQTFGDWNAYMRIIFEKAREMGVIVVALGMADDEAELASIADQKAEEAK